MKIDFRGYEVGGNPFDVILSSAISYLRNEMFNVIRYKGSTIPETNGDYLIKRINEQYKILDEMDQAEVELCRNNSIMYRYANHHKMNTFLFELEKMFPTVYTESNPSYCDDLEQLFLGEDSSEYHRRKSLIRLVTEEVSSKSKSDIKKFERMLSNCIDVIDSSVTDVDTHAKEYVDKYQLEISDVEFMKSTLMHMINEKECKINKMFDIMDIDNL